MQWKSGPEQSNLIVFLFLLNLVLSTCKTQIRAQDHIFFMFLFLIFFLGKTKLRAWEVAQDQIRGMGSRMRQERVGRRYQLFRLLEGEKEYSKNQDISSLVQPQLSCKWIAKPLTSHHSRFFWITRLGSLSETLLAWHSRLQEHAFLPPNLFFFPCIFCHE